MIVFLQNALGFFIQFFPCALMIFLPFPKEAYRFRRSYIFIGITAASLVTSVIFSAVLCLRDTQRFPQYVVISNSFMLAAILLILAAYIWLVRESFVKKILVFCIVLFYAWAVFAASNTLHSFLNVSQNVEVYPYNEKYLVLFVSATAVLAPIMLIAVINPLKEYIALIKPQDMLREFIIAIVSTSAYFVLLMYCDTQFGKVELFLLYLPIVVFLTLEQIFIYWLLFRESVRRLWENELQRTMEIQHFQYEKIISDMENTRRMRHDMRHHYNSLNDMLDRGQLDEMKTYLSKVIETTVKHDSETYCADITVNGLLQYYIGLARDDGIRCEVHAECDELSISPVDLTVLFGNAMENAIESCKKCTDDRWISIQIGTVQGSFAMEISNSCNKAHTDRRYATEDGFSPAEAFISDGAGRGYGLRSITHTAEEYGGSAAFRFNAQTKTFTTRIRLNIHADP